MLDGAAEEEEEEDVEDGEEVDDDEFAVNESRCGGFEFEVSLCRLSSRRSLKMKAPRTRDQRMVIAQKQARVEARVAMMMIVTRTISLRKKHYAKRSR